MTDFENIINTLNNGQQAPEAPEEPAAKAKITLISLNGSKVDEVTVGMTIGDLREKFGIADSTLVDESSRVLSNSQVITGDMKIFTSTPKQNG